VGFGDRVLRCEAPSARFRACATREARRSIALTPLAARSLRTAGCVRAAAGRCRSRAPSRRPARKARKAAAGKASASGSARPKPCGGKHSDLMDPFATASASRIIDSILNE
jgi:hypothetical protein